MMPEQCVVNWDSQMLCQLQDLPVMVKGLDQFGLMMLPAQELNQISSPVDTLELVATTADTLKMLQLNVQVLGKIMTHSSQLYDQVKQDAQLL